MAAVLPAPSDMFTDDAAGVLDQVLAGDASPFGTVTLFVEDHQPKNIAHHDPRCPLIHRRDRVPAETVMPLAGRRSFQSLGAARCTHPICEHGWKQVGVRLAVVSTIVDGSTMADRFMQLGRGVRPVTLKGQPVVISQLVAGYAAMCANLGRTVEEQTGSLIADLAAVVLDRLRAGYTAAEPMLVRLTNAEVFLRAAKLPTPQLEPQTLAYVFGGDIDTGLRARLDALSAIDGPEIDVCGPVWMSESLRRQYGNGPSRVRVPYPVACALLRDGRYRPEHRKDESFLERLVTTLLSERRPDSVAGARALLDAARAIVGDE